GFNCLYPPENKELAEEISRNGAVISEFPIDTPPLPQNFPRRNRLISGLGQGVLVVEAAENSGALITADFALEQGRDVFALPGRIDSANSSGTNSLIKQGAKLVTCPQDLLEELHCDIAGLGDEKKGPETGLKSGLAEAEARLYNLITSRSMHLDELVENSGLDISAISAILLQLQMKKMIRQLPGEQFIRS
ncbi:MAG TPA: DNA-processing protein DprA, partial [Candidatus Margulisiibacteriota bacterium]|nr:DNA-processing protein DprA [Candidatus Margulisiibacteriota bacterium]